MTPPLRPDGQDISVRAVAWISVAVFIALSVPQLWPDVYRRWFDGDNAIVDGLQALFLVAGLAVAVRTLVRRDIDWPGRARWWLGFIALGLLILLGEDFQWGQDIFGWEATGWFARHNDSGETNFHNSSVWLDQYPRAVLYVGMLLGAIVHPLMVSRRGSGLFDRLPSWFTPTLASMPPAFGCFVAWLPKLIDKSDVLGDLKLQVGRASERQEVFIYMFMLAYVLSLARRLPRRAADGAPA